MLYCGEPRCLIEFADSDQELIAGDTSMGGGNHMFLKSKTVRTSVGMLSVGVLAACGSTTSGQGNSSNSSSNASSVSYGVVAPFSGSSAFIGGIDDAGIYPAVKEINDAGGVLGHKIIVKTIDTKGDPADAITAWAQYVATTTNILGITGPTSTEGPGLVPIINKDQISMMAQAGEAEFDKSTFQYFWRPVPPDSSNGIAMAIQAKQQGLTNVAAVFGSDAGSQGDIPGVLSAAKAEGLNLVANVSLAPDQPSYSAQVARVLASNPQVIMTESDPTTAATFFGELAQQTTKNIAIFGTASTVTISYLQPIQKAVGAVRFSQMFSGISDASSSPNAATADFNKELLASGAQVPKPSEWEGNSHAQTNYSGVILQSLAATAAHSVKSSVYNSYITKVSQAGPGKTPVYTYAQGVKLLNEGKQIQYIGAAGPFSFNQYHNSYSGDIVQQYTAAGKLVTIASISESQITAVQ